MAKHLFLACLARCRFVDKPIRPAPLRGIGNPFGVGVFVIITYQKNRMSEGRSETDKRLTCRIHTRLTQERYDELSAMLKQSMGIRSMSELLRHILEYKKIVVQYYDTTVDNVMAELSGIRKELQAIGVNINQVTRVLHQLDLPEDKLFQAKEIIESFRQTEQKINELFMMMSNLSEKWLPE